MRLWSEFYDLAMPDLPGCPSIMLDNALRQSAITFCEQSLAWKYDHPSISVVPGVAEYIFSPPAEAAVHVIVYAALDGTEIEPHASEASLAAASWRNPTGVPRYVLAGPASLKLTRTWRCRKPDIDRRAQAVADQYRHR